MLRQPSNGIAVPLLRARQLFVMYSRTIATSSFVLKTLSFPWSRRFTEYHGMSRRTVGDRAINRGEMSCEIMRDDYLKTREKCKCKYISRLQPCRRDDRLYLSLLLIWKLYRTCHSSSALRMRSVNG